MKDNIGRTIYALAAICVAYIWADQNMKNYALEQKAISDRAKYETQTEYYKAKSTNDLVAVFQKVDPIPSFGCPVDGLYQKVKGKNGKITSKRIC